MTHGRPKARLAQGAGPRTARRIRALGGAGLLLLLWMGLGCGPRTQAPDEAQALLTALERLDPGAPAEDRLSALERLAAMALSAPELIELRDTCAEAHAGLLEVQVLQSEAKQALSEAEAEPRVRAAAGQRAAGALARAKGSLARARAALQRCRALTGPVARAVSRAGR